jgi:Arc/MetJ-type ribon-helix-helix transcriptional regulator
MPVDVSETLRQALSKLETEKGRIDRQIAAVREALKATGPGANAGSMVPTTRAKRGRRRMSPSQRKAVGARMKAYWAKRRGGASKGKKKKG